MDTAQDDLKEIRHILRDLTSRVNHIERAMGIEAAAVPQAAVPSPIPSGLATTPPSVSAHPVAPYPVVPPPKTRTLEPNLEARIGSHWLNRIGISAVLIGVSYFLKYAFENNWIGPAGRVTIGLLAGIAVVLWSEVFRSKGYTAFSYSLKAVGIGALYLSLWAASQVYNLLPTGVVFVAMFAVTVTTAVLALTQDAEILGAFALSGGFVTPLLLSTGQSREMELFSYVAILDLATLGMAMFRPWRRLLLLSYAGTLLLYVGWHSQYYNRNELAPTLGFASLFFVVFAIASLLARQDEARPKFFASAPLMLALVNAAVYFLQVYDMLEAVDKTDIAWFALALAAFYIGLSGLSKVAAQSAVNEELRLIHLALAVGFITIAIPLRLDAHWITIGWFVEAAVLLWVADRIQSNLLNTLAIGALALGVARLLFVDNFHSTQLFFNARMGTYALAIAVLGGVAWFAARREDDAGENAAAFALVALNVLALIALSREVADYYAQQMALLQPHYQHNQYHPRQWTPANAAAYRSLEIARDFTYSALGMAYGALLIVIGFWRGSAFVRWQALTLIAATIVKVFVYDTSQLDHIYRVLSFIVLGILLLAVSFAYQRDWLRLSPAKNTAHS